jgi:hypothetical protein
MDCSLYVISSPILYSIALLTGYVIAKYKNQDEIANLENELENAKHAIHILTKVQEQENLVSK